MGQSRLSLRRSISGIRLSLRIFIILLVYVRLHERAFTVADIVLRHALVTSEVATLHLPFRSDEMAWLIGVELMRVLIPEKLLTIIAHTVYCAYPHVANEMPQLQLCHIECRIRLDVGLDMEFLIKLLKKQSPAENPSWRIHILIDLPPFGDDTILHDTRVTYQSVHTVTCHHSDRVTFPDSWRCMLLWTIACCEYQSSYYYI